MPIGSRTPLRLATLAWVLVTSGGACLAAQQPAPPSADSIHELMEQDQADRQGIMNATAERWKEVGARDSVRRMLAHQLLAAGLVHSGQDYEDASLIFQHGGTPQDYLEAHVLAMAALAKGDTGAAWIAAATLDRYLQSIKQPQYLRDAVFLGEAQASRRGGHAGTLRPGRRVGRPPPSVLRDVSRGTTTEPRCHGTSSVVALAGRLSLMSHKMRVSTRPFSITSLRFTRLLGRR